MITKLNTRPAFLRAATHLLGASLLIWLLATDAAAQTSTAAATDRTTPLGIAPGSPLGSYALSGFDNINPYNGNLSFRLPLLTVGGRGGAQMTMMLGLNTKTWHVKKHTSNNPNIETIAFSASDSPWGAIQAGYGPGKMSGRRAGTFVTVCGLGGPRRYTKTLTRLTFVAPDGTEYELRDRLTDGEPKPGHCSATGFIRGKVFVSSDGTSVTFVSDSDIQDSTSVSLFVVTIAPTGYLMLRDGTTHRVEGGLIRWTRDRNGNKITFDYDTSGRVTQIVDSLNRVVTVVYGFQDPVHGLTDRITYKGFGQAQRVIRVVREVRLENALLAPHFLPPAKRHRDLFPQLYATVNDGTTLHNPRVVTAVILPDGRSYGFKYNHYGELARVDLPTGGAFEYFMAAGSGVSPTTPGEEDYQIYRRVAERRVYRDATTMEGKTIYTATTSSSGSPAVWETTVTIEQKTPDGFTTLAKEKHLYNGSGLVSLFRNFPSLLYAEWKEGKEKEIRHQTTGSPGTDLRKVENLWDQPTNNTATHVAWWSAYVTQESLHSSSPPPSKNPRLMEVTTTLMDSSPNKVSKQTFEYDEFNNVTDTCEYDFGSGAAGPMIRHSRTTYVTDGDYVNPNSGDPNNAVHLRSLPDTKIVNNSCAGSTFVSKTKYEYDNYTPDSNHAALVNRSNISGHDTTVFSTGRVRRGNVTRVERWIDASNLVASHQQYDIAGNVVKAIDPRGKVTTFNFNDNFGSPDGLMTDSLPPSELGSQSTYAFVTGVTNALNQTASTQYSYYIGGPVDASDANGVVSSAHYDDPLDRPTRLVLAARSASGPNPPAARSQTTFTYQDSSHTITTASDLNTYQDGLLQNAVIYDGLGRTVETRRFEPGGFITTTQSFDEMGRPKQSSNPFRSTTEDTYGYSIATYDALSRVGTVETFDKNNASTGTVTTTYDNNITTVRDQAGKQRQSTVDALGRLVAVKELQAHPNMAVYSTTTYTYDLLDNLLTVTQQDGATTQTRRFAYDMLSRLIFAVNPEQTTSVDLFHNGQSWALKYEYDAASNLVGKTDTRRNQQNQLVKVTYTYDDLNRLGARSYNDTPSVTPTVTYNYDTATNGVGRLASVVTNGVSTYSYTAYDVLGRVTACNQQTAGQTYTMGYAYNIAGMMTSESYPSGKVFLTEYDSAGRIAGVKKQGASGYYVGATASDATNRIQYSPHGAMRAVKLGNGLWEHTAFNSLLQPKEIGLGTAQTNSSLLKLEYEYGSASTNNGNVTSQKITAPITTGGSLVLTQNYTYDQVNRLTIAEEFINSTSQWKQTFGYDRFANRTSIVNTGQLPSATQLPVDAATNRVSSLQYDAAGNQLSDAGGRPLAYNADNKQKSFTDGGIVYTYSYDGAGRRVKREHNNGTLHTTVFVYNSGGQMIAEYQTDAVSPLQGGGVSYLTSDPLGSPRVVTNSTQAIKARHDYLPFGEDVGSNLGSRSSVAGYNQQEGLRQKFTSKERDNESGLDYFIARYYSSVQGRFTSTDPAFFQPLMAIDPQRFNLYGYGRNNPLKWIDPNGEQLFLGGNDSWLKTNVLYEMAGGQAEFDKYFEVRSGQVFLKFGVNISSANEGVQELAGLVSATENYLFFAGTDGEAAAGLFQGAKDSKGKLTNAGKRLSNLFTCGGGYRTGCGTQVGTLGRPSANQPANLVTGDPVFAVIAYNTNAEQTQTKEDYGTLSPVPADVQAAQKAGVGQAVRPVSFFIHEATENRKFAQQGAGSMNYGEAHAHAIGREAAIRKALSITGGFAGGGLETKTK